MATFKNERERGDVRTLQTVSRELHIVEIAYLHRSEQDEAYQPLVAKLWRAVNLTDEALDLALNFADDAEKFLPDGPTLEPQAKTLAQKAAAYDALLSRIRTTLQDCYIERDSPITTKFELEGETQLQTLMDFLCQLLTDADESALFSEAFRQKVVLDRKLKAWEHGLRVSLDNA